MVQVVKTLSGKEIVWDAVNIFKVNDDCISFQVSVQGTYAFRGQAFLKGDGIHGKGMIVLDPYDKGEDSEQPVPIMITPSEDHPVRTDLVQKGYVQLVRVR